LSTVTALKRFFGWLALQNGYKSKIPVTDIEFFNLSEKDTRAAKAPGERRYPTIEQVKHVLSGMPDDTDIHKRDRALIAFTAITGVRDGALVSLRLKHVDPATAHVMQNPREVATKASKRIDTYFFRSATDARTSYGNGFSTCGRAFFSVPTIRYSQKRAWVSMPTTVLPPPVLVESSGPTLGLSGKYSSLHSRQQGSRTSPHTASGTCWPTLPIPIVMDPRR
jgi:integrase